MYQITFNTLIKQLADRKSQVIQNLWCDTIGKLFFTCCIDNVAMTAIGPVLSGLHGNQLLGNQSIFDFENWLLALPPSPLRGSSAPWKTDSEFSQASWMSSSQPKNTNKHNGHYVTTGGRGGQGSYSVQLLLLASVAFPLWHQSHCFWRRKTKAISFASSFNRNGLRLLDVEDNSR